MIHYRNYFSERLFFIFFSSEDSGMKDSVVRRAVISAYSYPCAAAAAAAAPPHSGLPHPRSFQAGGGPRAKQSPALPREFVEEDGLK